MNALAIFNAAKWHNSNDAYRQAGYPPLVPHRAEIRVEGLVTRVVYFNVADGDDAATRLAAIDREARYHTTVITIAEISR